MADLKTIARSIFTSTAGAIDIPAAIERKLSLDGSLLLFDGGLPVDLNLFRQVHVVAIGKAAHAMVEGLTRVLGPDVKRVGIVSAPEPPRQAVAGWRYFSGGHPMPNRESFEAAEAILELLKTSDENTIVFFLLSGGGSALVEMPLDSALRLEDVQQVHRALVTCGGSIDEINTVRKHLSAVKGGRLAVAAGAATKLTLAVSDVPLGKESALASGPTVCDPTTTFDALRVIGKYSLLPKFPSELRQWLGAGRMPETPKKGNAAFANAEFYLLLGMDDLFHPAHRAAEACGFIACCDNTTDDWPVEKAADHLLTQLRELQEAHGGRRVALIADGELSSPVTGNGIGGRNSAFVLACVEKIAAKKIAVLSVGTDGVDGNSPGAGAVADGETLARAKELGLDPQDYFARSDAFRFFEALGDAVVTGPTGNNLRDLRILLSEP